VGEERTAGARPLPAWYDDAKLGVFLHWGLYSVPGWAPRVPDIQTILTGRGPAWLLANNPYAEWYANTLAIPDSPTRRHHDETYGPGVPYDAFVEPFDAASAGADLDALAELCRSAGARYVVLTTKHHDGFCLWPAARPHPLKGPWRAGRDLVGGLTEAVRAAGLHMGLYYSGGYDWPFNRAVLRHLSDLLLAVPATPAYAHYAEDHLDELVARYQPSVLWNDIGWPPGTDLPALFARYRRAVPDGVVNDRWLQGRRGPVVDRLLRGAGAGIEAAWGLIPAGRKRLTFPGVKEADFLTPEYETPRARRRKWEATRGVGHSFGANRNEDPADVLSGDDLVRLLVDVVAHGGNLLIGVGPDPAGVVPPWQAAPLLDLGRWLAGHGEAVYGTRPWAEPAASTAAGEAVRLTLGPDALHLCFLDRPDPGPVRLASLVPSGPIAGRLLGGGPVTVTGDAGGVRVDWPGGGPGDPVPVLALSPPGAVTPRT
jgi:alpha-L-fucosidase